jgi:RNA polymerase sigma-70 factor (ECF subfamily)
MDAKALEKRFLEAYEAHSDALFRHCYFRVYNRDRARDLTQEAFTKTWDYLLQGKEIENLRAFLYQVATNLIIDESRRRKKQTELSLERLQETGFDPGEDETDRLTARADGRMLMPLLARLDSKYSQVIVLRYIDDLSPREIAEVVGKTENVVSVRIHRGLRKLRKLAQDKQNGKDVI